MCVAAITRRTLHFRVALHHASLGARAVRPHVEMVKLSFACISFDGISPMSRADCLAVCDALLAAHDIVRFALSLASAAHVLRAFTALFTLTTRFRLRKGSFIERSLDSAAKAALRWMWRSRERRIYSSDGLGDCGG